MLETGERARKLARIDDKIETLIAERDDLKVRLEKTEERLRAAERELLADGPDDDDDDSGF